MNVPAELSGLTVDQVLHSRSAHGRNKIEQVQNGQVIMFLKQALADPMLVLLAAAATVYFIHGDVAEGIFLLFSIVLVSSISHYQEYRSKNALQALRKLTQPKCKVIRNSKVEEISSEDIVVDDLMIVEEGTFISADGIIIQANDFTVNESILTGESLPVEKDSTSDRNLVYNGTSVVSGLAICRVTSTGIKTRVGQIGKSIEGLKNERSPLQIQITRFVKKMAAAGAVIFFVIWLVNMYKTGLVMDSLLNSLTLAMSILPEEIPVAFATFMALGAWRLMQLGIIVKDTKTVETLGSATVICVDKTGTITRNEMALDKIYVHSKSKIYSGTASQEIKEVVTAAMWASEPIPFDPMEKALHSAYAQISETDARPSYSMVKEYPLGGKPPLMTHVFENAAGDRIIAAKGAPEAIIRQSELTPEEKQSISMALQDLTSKGYRVLGVGIGHPVAEYPQDQKQFAFTFKGLIAFYDPPKANISEVLSRFYSAGIKVKIITGDDNLTTATIANQIGFKGADKIINGDRLMSMGDKEFSVTVAHTNIFARMYPEAKLRVIQALRNQSEIVAMTGDGVNDGPALKAANIGIAMGQKGSEIAKQASALVLADDNLERMVDAVAMGRKIYNNLKKAIQYIISIHIPIILIVFLPLILGWPFPAIFSPVHVIFLELIMGPTCSIIYENEPIEKNLMDRKPRVFTETFFNGIELSISIFQGLAITIGLIAVYWYAVSIEHNLPATTSMVFLTLITSNIALTLVNRSFYYSVFATLKYSNILMPIVIGVTVLLVVILYSVPLLREFFQFELLDQKSAAISVAIGFLSVIWIEIYKLVRRQRKTT